MYKIFISKSKLNFVIKVEDISEKDIQLLKTIFPSIEIEYTQKDIYNIIIKNVENIIFNEQKFELISDLRNALINFNSLPKSMKIGNRIFDFQNKVYVMGIVNITPDSFYDGGKYFNFEDAKKRVDECIKEGADLIDIGGESTRPGSIRISEEEELRRVIPIIKYAKKEFDVPISIDTYKSKVAEEAISAGADLINDISGLVADLKMADIVSKYGLPVVLMHIRGNPKIMQKDIYYEDVVQDVIRSIYTRMNFAKMNGIKEDKIIIDPGIGFGKTVEQNVELILRLNEFKVLGRPILIGISRKSFLGKILDLPVEERLEASLAALAIAIMNGANIARVHDVKESIRVANLCSYFRNRINKS